jgi:hypothetical protein
MYNEYEEFEEHPDFKIIPTGDHYQLWLVDYLTGLPKERFGLYSHWWKAERDAREMQHWRNCETWD